MSCCFCSSCAWSYPADQRDSHILYAASNICSRSQTKVNSSLNNKAFFKSCEARKITWIFLQLGLAVLFQARSTQVCFRGTKQFRWWCLKTTHVNFMKNTTLAQKGSCWKKKTQPQRKQVCSSLAQTGPWGRLLLRHCRGQHCPAQQAQHRQQHPALREPSGANFLKFGADPQASNR